MGVSNPSGVLLFDVLASCNMPEATELTKYTQNDSHDWLGDAAEDYVRYCFAREGFEVFGSGKWSTDMAVRDRETNRWYRVEVKSTGRPHGKPLRPGADNLRGRVDLLVEVVFLAETDMACTSLQMIIVSIGKDGKRERNKTLIRTDGDLRAFLNKTLQSAEFV